MVRSFVGRSSANERSLIVAYPMILLAFIHFRFFYLSATSDLVCVIGMVNVKVLGQVRNGERIYASMEHPGVAIPQSRVCDAVFKDAFLLGQTLTGQDADPGEVSLVQSFVSVMLSISSSHVTRAVGDLREHVKEDLKNEVKQIKRKCVRGN